MQTHHVFGNGDRMPLLGLGTWLSSPGRVGDAVTCALREGYRHIDCAWIYGNEAETGAAIRRAIDSGAVRRETLWVTSKLWNNAHQPEAVLPALKESLDRLGLDYLDLYLMHWPVALAPGVTFPVRPEDFVSPRALPSEATWAAMETLHEQGLVRHLGVANFTQRRLAKLMDSARIRPEVNQVEMHPYLQQYRLLSFCRSNDVLVTAYSPLGSPDRPARVRKPGEPVLMEDPLIARIAERNKTTVAQVLISWALHRGTAVIPKSVTPRRIHENFQAARIQLSEEDMQRIAELDRHFRYISGDIFCMEGSPYSIRYLWNEDR